MFSAIAPRYDLLNHLLSLNIDRRWRRLTRRRLELHLGTEPAILDLCSGTGDLALELSRLGAVVGCDFCHPMLVRGHEKVRSARLAGRIQFVEGDALQLPFAGGHFDAVTIAFGLRNLQDYREGLKEMSRVLSEKGILAVLEFSQPRLPLFRHLYLFYFLKLLPKLGGWISGDSQAYSYLPQSVREFPDPEALAELIREAGFNEVRFYRLTGGVAYLHLGFKSCGPRPGQSQS